MIKIVATIIVTVFVVVGLWLAPTMVNTLQDPPEDSELMIVSHAGDADLGPQDITISFGDKQYYVVKDQPEYIYQLMLIDLSSKMGSSFANMRNNPKQALKHMLKAVEHIEVYNAKRWPLSKTYKLQYINIYMEVAELYKQLSKLEQMNAYYAKAVSLTEYYRLEGNWPASIYRRIAIELDTAGYQKEAFNLFKKEYEYFQQRDSQKDMVEAMISMAISSTGQSKLDYYHKAQNMAESLHDPHIRAHIDNNLAYTYAKDGQFEKALPLAKQALAHAETIKDSSLYPKTLDTMGYIYDGLGHLAKAEEYLKLAIEYNAMLPKSASIQQSLAINHSTLGHVYIKHLRFDEACKHWELAMAYARNTGNLEKIADIEHHIAEKQCAAGGVDWSQ